MKKFRFLFFLLSNIILFNAAAQPLNDPPSDSIIISYTNPTVYTIGGITISGIQFLDPNDLIARTGLRIGDKVTVPSDHLSNAIKKLWEEGLVGDITLRIGHVEGNLIFLDFNL